MIAKTERPEGALENDFSDLNDWTVTDIANSPSTTRDDQANAEAEIARRKDAGIYDTENVPHETKKDFLSHGYGIEDGRVLYPKQDYREWLKSDRTGERPRGVVRESIDDRIESERAAIEEEIAEEEQKQERDRIIGEIAHQEFERRSNKPLIRSMSKESSEENDTRAKRKEEEKAKTLERDVRRREKEFRKYGNPFSNPEAKMRKNLPMLEIDDSATEKHGEKEDSTKSPSEKRIERAFERASEQFKKGFIDYYTEGAINELSSGSFNINPKSFIAGSFLENEKGQIDGILASKKERGRFWESFRNDVVTEEINEWNTLPNVEEAERDAILTAIERGATLKQNGFDRSEIQSILPIEEHGDGRLQNFMRMYGVNPDSKEAQISSYTGFANIIERIVEQESRDKIKYHDGKATENGFKILDWYYETFNYGDSRNTQGFLDTMEGYRAIAGSDWNKKYSEYMEEHRRQDLEELEKKDEQEPLPSLEESRELDDDSLIKVWEELANKYGIDNVDAWQEELSKHGIEVSEIFKDKGWPKQDGGGWSVNNAPVPLNKLNAFLKNFIDIKKQHPNAKISYAILKDQYQGKIPHLVVEYPQENSSVAILEPIKSACYAASYVWVSQDPQYMPSDWMKIFSNNPADPNDIISKYNRLQRGDVKRFYHRAAPKKGLSAEDNMWKNIFEYIDKIA